MVINNEKKMRLTKKQRKQINWLMFGLLLLMWSAYELWIDVKNENNFKIVNSFIIDEQNLNENANNFKRAYERKQYSIMKSMMEGKLIEKNENLKVKDFIYMGETIHYALKNNPNVNPNSDLDIMRKQFLNAWNTKGVHVLKKEQNLVALSSIDCKYSMFCYYKKDKLKEDLDKLVDDYNRGQRISFIVSKIENLNSYN